MASWFAKVKGVLGGRRREKNAALPRFSKGPVQCELSLDNVKVLRNDLSDTDFEVIAKPAQQEKPSAPVPQSAPAETEAG